MSALLFAWPELALMLLFGVVLPLIVAGAALVAGLVGLSCALLERLNVT